MTTMDCADIKALLSGLIDDEVDEETRHLAERHLGGCTTCRALLDEAEALDRLLVLETEASFDQLPAGFEDSVMRQISAPPVPIIPYSMRVTTWVGWMAAAASLALALTIWVMDRRASFPESGPAPQARNLAIGDQDVKPLPLLEKDRDASNIQVASLTTPLFGSELDPFGDVSMFALPATDDGMTFDGESSPEPDPTQIVHEKSRALSALSDRPTLTADEAQTLYMASILLESIAEADTTSFMDFEMARQILEYDDLLPRLTVIRQNLDAADRPAVLAAESIFTRIQHGPLDLNDIKLLRETVLQLKLLDEFETLNRRGPQVGEA